jgi:hypothetical protein
MSISTGLYPNLDLWNANKLHYITLIFTNYNLKNFKNVIKTEFESLNKWFKANTLSLAARSMAWVCGCSLAGIEGSNPARGMEACLL